jgi:hypothetical protein
MTSPLRPCQSVVLEEGVPQVGGLGWGGVPGGREVEIAGLIVYGEDHGGHRPALLVLRLRRGTQDAQCGLWRWQQAWLTMCGGLRKSRLRLTENDVLTQGRGLS